MLQCYMFIIVVRCEGQVVDWVDMFFGICIVCFDVDQGFFLNGCYVKLYGVNNYQDYVGFGVVLVDSMYEVWLRMFKVIGVNVI